MTTAGDICFQALRIANIVGLGQTASATDMNDTFLTLNRMLATWQSRRWLVPSLAEVIVPNTQQQSYTVGVGGAINIPRPDAVEDAFVRLLYQSATNRVDLPLAIIRSREDYNFIALKSLSTIPMAVYYSPDTPLGTLFVWPIPTALYEVHVFVKSTLARFATLASAFTLPGEYEEALLYNLVGRLSINYGIPMASATAALAEAALNTIRVANTQIPTLAIPGALRGRARNGGWYNAGGPIETNAVTDSWVIS